MPGWLEDLPEWDKEPVFASSMKYHRSSCSVLQNVDHRYLHKLSSWKKAADRGLEPCRLCRPYFEPPEDESEESGDDEIRSGPQLLPTEHALGKSVSSVQLAAWRREVVQLLESFDQNKPAERESVARRITRLADSKTIPRHVAAFMRVITEMRNLAEYESSVFSVLESIVVAAAREAVWEWAQTQGLKRS